MTQSTTEGGNETAAHRQQTLSGFLGPRTIEDSKGGANNRKVYVGNDRDIPAPQNACDVKNFLSEAMAEIRAGKMDPKLGTTLGYLGTSLLKAIETSDLEERLEKLENGLKSPA